MSAISGSNADPLTPGVENLGSIAIALSSSSESKGYSYRTPDQGYLIERIQTAHPEWVALRPGAITWINNNYGEAVVTEALRILHGDMPAHPIARPLAYLVAVCKRVASGAA